MTGRKRNSQAIRSLQKKMNERKKEFIRTIADGKIELLKDEERQKIIEKMIRNNDGEVLLVRKWNGSKIFYREKPV